METGIVIPAEVMSVPGAKISKQLPTLEYEARASESSVAPTVRAFAVEAGE